MPQPRRNFKSSDYAKLGAHREAGGNEATAAELCGMDEVAFKTALRRDKRARRSWERGKGRRELWLIERLHDPTARSRVPAIFELKCRHGYIDSPKEQPEESRVKITFQIPAALSPEKYKQLIEVTPPKALKEAGADDDS